VLQLHVLARAWLSGALFCVTCNTLELMLAAGERTAVRAPMWLPELQRRTQLLELVHETGALAVPEQPLDTEPPSHIAVPHAMTSLHAPTVDMSVPPPVLVNPVRISSTVCLRMF
jgi:hypothetical protein